MFGKSTWEKIWNNRAYLKNHFYNLHVHLAKRQEIMRVRKMILKLIEILFTFFFAFPIFWNLIGSLTPKDMIGEAFQKLEAGNFVRFADFVGSFSLEQYQIILFQTPDYLQRFWNSVFLVAPIVCFQLIIALFTSYGFCRVKGKAAAMLFFLYMMLMMMPYQVTVIPNYIAMKQLHLTETNWSIWLPGIFSPFSVYLLTKYMKRIPKSLFDAARIDGAGEIRIAVSVAFPVCKGQIAACGLLILFDYWNMAELPLVMFSNASSYPLSVYLSRVQEKDAGIAFAAAVIYLIPVLLLFLAGEEELREGLSAVSGIKE